MRLDLSNVGVSTSFHRGLCKCLRPWTIRSHPPWLRTLMYVQEKALAARANIEKTPTRYGVARKTILYGSKKSGKSIKKTNA
mmetsp:Transcript_8470/g.14296  ORF Transcript_8470/g.14296 Transcript_8470/m.14296 type:complete len:82 (+) Transcript_8470:141-386(+)